MLLESNALASFSNMLYLKPMSNMYMRIIFDTYDALLSDFIGTNIESNVREFVVKSLSLVYDDFMNYAKSEDAEEQISNKIKHVFDLLDLSDDVWKATKSKYMAHVKDEDEFD